MCVLCFIQLSGSFIILYVCVICFIQFINNVSFNSVMFAYAMSVIVWLVFVSGVIGDSVSVGV